MKKKYQSSVVLLLSVFPLCAQTDNNNKKNVDSSHRGYSLSGNTVPVAGCTSSADVGKIYLQTPATAFVCSEQRIHGKKYSWQPLASTATLAFSNITSGANTSASMVVGSGASLSATGRGAIAATSVPASGVSGLAPSATIDTTNAANITRGTLSSLRLPNPSPTSLGGTQSAAPVAHQWVNSISTSGIPSLSQPTAADISGLGTAATQPISAFQPLNHYALSSYPNLSAALNALGATLPVTLLMDTPSTVTSNLSIPANVTLQFNANAVITCAGSPLITFNAPPTAGEFQIFGPGCNVNFPFLIGSGGSGPPIDIYAEWFGQIPDQVTDSTSAINAAIASCATLGACNIVLKNPAINGFVRTDLASYGGLTLKLVGRMTLNAPLLLTGSETLKGWGAGTSSGPAAGGAQINVGSSIPTCIVDSGILATTYPYATATPTVQVNSVSGLIVGHTYYFEGSSTGYTVASISSPYVTFTSSVPGTLFNTPIITTATGSSGNDTIAIDPALGQYPVGSLISFPGLTGVARVTAATANTVTLSNTLSSAAAATMITCESPGAITMFNTHNLISGVAITGGGTNTPLVYNNSFDQASYYNTLSEVSVSPQYTNAAPAVVNNAGSYFFIDHSTITAALSSTASIYLTNQQNLYFSGSQIFLTDSILYNHGIVSDQSSGSGSKIVRVVTESLTESPWRATLNNNGMSDVLFDSLNTADSQANFKVFQVANPTGAVIWNFYNLHPYYEYSTTGFSNAVITPLFDDKGVYANAVTVPFSAYPTFNLSLAPLQSLTLTGNAATAAINVGGTPLSYVTFHLCQDSIGGHSFTWPANVSNGMTISATSNSAPNACYDQTFESPDGVNLYATTPGVGPALTAVPSISVSGSGCTLGSPSGNNTAGLVPVTGSGSACVVTISWATSFAYPNHSLCGPLQNRTSGIIAAQVTDTPASATFNPIPLNSGDTLQYGSCTGY